MQESPIFTRTYDLLKWLIPATLKFPKSQRFVMAERVRDTALDFQDLLIAAVFSQDKAPILAQADIELQKLRVHLRLCFDFKLISMGHSTNTSPAWWWKSGGSWEAGGKRQELALDRSQGLSAPAGLPNPAGQRLEYKSSGAKIT